MNLLSWNCRGLGGSSTFRELKRLIQTQNPSIIFLCETKINQKRFEDIRNQLQMFGIAVDAKRRKGGLAMFWRKDLDVNILGYSANFIDITVKSDFMRWRCTGVYGQPKAHLCQETWEMLRTLAIGNSLPWICMGDFNEVLHQWECRGGRVRPWLQINQFRKVAHDLAFREFSTQGYPFTWARNWRKPKSYRAKLDRALANSQFLSFWKFAKTSHVDTNLSDHLPIVVLLRKNFWRNQGLKEQIKKRRFKFESMWANNEQVRQLISDTWKDGSVSLIHKLNACRENLVAWKRTFGNIFHEADKLREQIAELKFHASTDEKENEIACLQDDLERRLDQQEQYWHQRSRVLWMKSGDKNTAYFHNVANCRKRSKQITGLKDDDGNWVEEPQALQELIISYFKKLFDATPLNQALLHGTLERISPRIAEADYCALAQEFTAEEVKRALFEMHPLKAPGPDGFNPQFFQQFWTIVGEELSNSILQMLREEEIPMEVNKSTIVLIPKVKQPQEITQLRPISLCNVAYRVLSKMIANRLKSVLPGIISPFQTAFLLNRSITDNVLIAHEMHNLIKKKRTGRKGFMSIKLDMSKAFDRLEWGFIISMLEKYGFPEHIVRIINSCISSVSFSFSVNNDEFGVLQPSRGVRQGDPISPYLFILCSDVLSRLLIDATICRKIHGIQAGKQGPYISHLMFADDTILFGEASVEEATVFADILHIYCQISGQEINKQKSGQSKAQLFANIRERMLGRIDGWEEKLLSRAGKEVLIKSIIQSIPTYAISVFKLPENLIDTLHSQIANFWWGRKDGKRNIHWLSWQKLCQSKELGGLGLRDLKVFNIAMLAKQVWNLLSDENSLLFNVYKHLYFRNEDFMDVAPSKNSSFSWRSILWARDQIREGILWGIGNGKRVRLTKDKWIFDAYPRKIYPLASLNDMLSCSDTKVDWLIDKENGVWKEVFLNLFCIADVDAIRRIPLGRLEEEDFPRWPYTKNGIYSVKSGYHYIQQQRQSQQAQSSRSGLNTFPKILWKKLWSLKIAPKVKSFCWRLILEALPCYENLSKRRVPCENWCFLCAVEDGSLVHLFAKCPVAIQIWALTFLERYVHSQEVTNMTEWIKSVFENCNMEVVEKFCIILWFLWKGRNEACFNGKKADPLRLSQFALGFWNDYKEANVNTVPSEQSSDAIRWKPPPIGCWKLNVDAACDGKGNNGLGMVVRDAYGNFIFAHAQSIPHWVDVFSLEAKAIEVACNWCKEENLSRALIESDAQVIIQMLLRVADRRDYSRIFVQETLKMIQGKDYTFSWCPREANGVAHLLANFAKNNPGSYSWQMEAPAFLAQIVDDEKNFL